MTEFQSSNPFPTSRPPPVQYRFDSVFPTMSPQESRILVEGVSKLFDIVDIPLGASISQLKPLVHRRIKVLDNVKSRNLELYKLNVTVPIDPDNNLRQRLADLGDLDKYSKALSSAEKVGEVFPESHAQKDLHIVVQCPTDDQPSSKRPRLTDPISDEELQNTRKKWLHVFSQLWGKGLEEFHIRYIESRTDDSGASFRIMKVHPAFGLKLKELLVRDEWDITWRCAEEIYAKRMDSFIIVGKTGIGKTLSLYYFLARRLALGLTTFFQNVPDYVWLFNKSGVCRIASKIPWGEIEGISENSGAWALMDSNWEVEGPAPFLVESPLFIVQAASPRNTRVDWEEYHGRTRFFYTNPFSLNEIFQGNTVQLESSDTNDLRDFFIEYGPSARECYRATSNESGLATYHEKLQAFIEDMPIGKIDRAVTERKFIPRLGDDLSNLVVLIRPADDSRFKCRATVITRTVLRLLWQTHKVQLKRKSKELFQTFARNRETSVSAGWLFEAIVHDALEHGIDVPIAPMVVKPNKCSNAVNDKHNDQALVTEPLCYYVPVDPSHLTYDSFTFELAPCASYEGPILNPKNKEIYDKAVLDKNSNIGLFTIFQVTTAAEYDMNEKGLNYICTIADHNGFDAIGIRYIGIIPVGKETTFRTLIAWRGKLDIYSMSTTLYELS